MSNEKLINHWAEGSDKNFEDMIAIYEAKRYDWALYVGHLALEKLFKAEINTFNIEAKYETQKNEFNLKCTKEYTEEQINIIKGIRECLKQKLM